jgi:hypothetical protein
METTRFKRLRVLRPALFAAAVAVLTQFVYADSEYADAWGPSAGSKAPMLSAGRSRRQPAKPNEP